MMNADFIRKLAIPQEVKEMYPLNDELKKVVEKRAEEIRNIFEGKDERLLLIIGPCSADREDSVLDYISRLKKVQDKVSDKIFIIPRIYTNKPRTTGDGYKGLLHQPDPLKKPDLFKGIVAIRELHMAALKETGFTAADEMLYPENHKYLDDLLAYVAIGARSVEDQQHRLVASAVGIPVGMKNPISGSLSVVMNSIHAAQQSHTFIYRGWETMSHGNPHAHAVLRGFVDHHGKTMPNYDYETLCRINELYSVAGLNNPFVVVDTNHSNSGKDAMKQPEIAYSVLNSIKDNGDLKKLVRGFMIESYIEDGKQDPSGKEYGKSITDACLGWEKTEKMILKIADLI